MAVPTRPCRATRSPTFTALTAGPLVDRDMSLVALAKGSSQAGSWNQPDPVQPTTRGPVSGATIDRLEASKGFEAAGNGSVLTVECPRCRPAVGWRSVWVRR